MRSVFRIVFLLSILACGTHGLAQQPHWYVLLEPGNVRDYVGPYNSYHEEVVGYQDGYSVVRREGNAGPAALWESLWLIDEGGDVWMVGANGEMFSQGICFIDMPIEIGKRWGSTWGEWDQWYQWTTMTGWADWNGVPCLVIETDYHDAGGDSWASYWYADGYGLVYHAASCFGCGWSLEASVVESELKTWGAVKALFR